MKKKCPTCDSPDPKRHPAPEPQGPTVGRPGGTRYPMASKATPAFTPGPWQVDYVVDGAFSVLDIEGCTIASRGEFRQRHGEFVANAHLIAAAPAMYAALLTVRAVLAWDGSLPRPADVPDADALIAMVDAVILKAEGSAS